MTDIIANEILGFIKISRVQAKKRRRKKYTTYGTIQISTESFYPALAKLKLKKKSSDQFNIRTGEKTNEEVKKMIWYD